MHENNRGNGITGRVQQDRGGSTDPSVKPLTWDDIRAEAFGELGISPGDFYQMTFEEYGLKKKGYINRIKREFDEKSVIARRSTFLICDVIAAAMTGKGLNAQTFMNNWPVGEEVIQEISERAKELLENPDKLNEIRKKVRENLALKKLNGGVKDTGNRRRSTGRKKPG